MTDTPTNVQPDDVVADVEESLGHLDAEVPEMASEEETHEDPSAQPAAESR